MGGTDDRGALAPSNRQVGQSFNVKIRGYADEILLRDYTRIGKGGIDGSAGLGNFCDVDVPPEYAGKHMMFNREYEKPKTPTP
jgi:hypothetical protein